ncbi:helix-turn-helix domain-containing protein [Achromobacter xylosoxidans]|uniref:helix-turn-helix domain-containing protein n=1 Tax=Alcaligenes xylosoxydans xylosoxydans TaxID=85698 RepID=UPI0010414137|nr:helix-turn-helix transcriptional regulator [Achromobacter xylosoxidans]
MEFLSDSAVRGQGIPGQERKLPCPWHIEAMVQTYGWTALRAWRSWLSFSQDAMAARLGIATATYAQIEQGVVALCEWTEPGIARRVFQMAPAMRYMAVEKSPLA